MHEELEKAKFSEHQTKFLNDLKYGIFKSERKKKARHYSLEKIKEELYEVYKYRNELEENKDIDAISKKINSVIRSTSRFWGNLNSLQGVSQGFESQSFVKQQGLKGGSVGESTKALDTLSKDYIINGEYKKNEQFNNFSD